MFLSSLTFVLMFWFTNAFSPLVMESKETTAAIGKMFIHKLPVETISQSGYTFKAHAADSDILPMWLSFNNKNNILLGVPSHHSKGKHHIKLDVVDSKKNKTVIVLDFLLINVIPIEEHINSIDNVNQSSSSLHCPGHTTVMVATLVFDLNIRKMSGEKRVELIRKVSEWIDIDSGMFSLLPGKGDKSAFNLRDVVVLTGGPGSVSDAQERGVSISWKIGCGDSIAGMRPVSMLKLASETGEFKKFFQFPVSSWHVLYGMPRHHQVIRVRRQQPAGVTPMPTSTFVPPTVSRVTRTKAVIGTPIISSSPSVVMSPSITRISPSPTSFAPIPTSTPPPVNTPPVLIDPIGTLQLEIDVYFPYNVPRNTFDDKEDGDTRFLKLSVTDKDNNPLPDDFWLKFDPNTQTFSGTPTKIGTYIICLVAHDSGNLSTNDTITIVVYPPNTPPKLINPVDLIKLFVGEPIKLEVPYDTFYDKEQGDTTNLLLSMRTADGDLLPSWISFDSATQTIYALPLEEQIGKPEFLLIAADNRSKTARDALEFQIFPEKSALNNIFGLVLDAPFEKFEESAKVRVELCVQIGDYFDNYFNTSYRNMRVRNYKSGSVKLEWSFANISDISEAESYKDRYMIGESRKPIEEFDDHIKNDCPIQDKCPVEDVYVILEKPTTSTAEDPNIIARVSKKGGGKWWKYTIIPVFVVAAVVLIIGLIIIICIRCRRKNKMDKKDKVVFLYRKKPAVFREEYPVKEMYGDQPLITPSEKAPLPPPAYPRSSTPTDDPNASLLDNTPSYQPPSFDNGPDQGSNTRSPAPSYRLPPPYVAP